MAAMAAVTASMKSGGGAMLGTPLSFHAVISRRGAFSPGRGVWRIARGAAVPDSPTVRQPDSPTARRYRQADSSGRPGGLAEPVAHGPDGLDQMSVFFAQLGPHPPHVHVNRAGTAVVLVAPYPAEQRFAGEHFAGAGRQEPQKLVLHVGEVQHPSRHRRLAVSYTHLR